MRQTYAEHFWDNVLKTEDCWFWTMSLSHGYGQMWTGKRVVLAHRIAWELTNGQIPKGLKVCHHCDTPQCVRPAHLFLGTQADNLRDMLKKGRHGTGLPLNGVDNPRAKLTEDDVKRIRRIYADGGHSLRSLAAEYGVKHTAIASILHRRNWKHIT